MYWFMLPVSTLVATTAMLTGIGGAAIFIPIFMIVFPLLGPEYVIIGHASAIAVALLTQSFGFSSGLVRYWYRGLIDFNLAKRLLKISVPLAVVGSITAQYLAIEPFKIFYGFLMFSLAFLLIYNQKWINKSIKKWFRFNKKDNVNQMNLQETGKNNLKKDRFVAGLGGILTGITSVGIGELIMPQLFKSCKISMPVSAATSVLVVLVTVIAASLTHVLFLISNEGFDAIPWDLLVYTIPGVIIGGQIGAKIQKDSLSEKIRKLIPVLFVITGISMMLIIFKF